MFKLEHRCTDEDPEPVPYSIQIGQRDIGGGKLQPMTRVICPKCREEFYVLGHEMFAGARPTTSASGAGSIPGFVIPRAGLSRN